MSIKIVFNDGTEKIFERANYYDEENNETYIKIIKRTYDKDNECDEDDTIAIIPHGQIRYLESLN